ncbi:MAG: mechanosensitive ion channel family protein [Marmoricola sp.]
MPLVSFSFMSSFQDAFSSLMNYIPQLIGALIILVIGYFIAKIIGTVITKLLEKVHFDDTMDRAGVKGFLDRSGTGLTPSSLLGKVVFWFIFVMVLVMFASALGVPQISAFLNQLIAFIPNIFAAILIIFLAALLGRFLAGIVRGLTGSEFLARAANIVIIVYAVFIALVQLHIAQALTGPTFLIILGGLALAFGLAFGLGGRDDAQALIHRMTESGPTGGSGAHQSGGSESAGGTDSPYGPGD